MSELLEPAEVPLAPDAMAETVHIARAASIIALGNVASRALGLMRDTVKANLFGATGLVSAYEAAAIVPTLLYDLLIGGMVSSALVPVFSEYAHDKRALWRLASLVITLAVVVLAALALTVELAAPLAARLISGGLADNLLAETASLLRVTVIATLFISLSGIIGGLLQALKRFTLPAFTAAVFNAAIVVCALLFGARYGIASMAIGLLAGALLQVLLQLPGLRDAHLRPAWDWHHPGLRQIGRLYLPVILGLAVNQLAIILSFNLASRANEEAISWMRYATTLIQFPLGLVATAISIAILPTLSQHAALKSADGHTAFKETLARGMKLVLVLIVPAAVGLWVMAHPIIALLFEHGQFAPSDTDTVTRVLYFYLPGLVFAAIDLPLVFAFYARKDTLTPAVVGLIANVAIYLLAALAPSLILNRSLRVVDLAFANSVQWISHALIMLWLLERRIGGLRGFGLRALTLKALAGSAAMGAGTWLAAGALTRGLASTPPSTLTEAVTVGGAALIGVMVYLAAMTLLRVPEVTHLRDRILRRVARPDRARYNRPQLTHPDPSPSLSGLSEGGEEANRLSRESLRTSLPSTLYTEDYFLTACEGYAEFVASHGEHLSRRLTAAFEVAKVDPGMRVLDVGCGRGEILRHCARLGAYAYGIDYASVAVTLSRDVARAESEATGRSRIGVYRADAKCLPYADALFDRVLIFDVVEHLFPWELDAALKEVRRVLKPGGMLVIHTAPNRWYDAYAYPLVRLVRTLQGKGQHYPANPRALNVAANVDVHVNEQDMLSLRSYLKRAGFGRVKTWLDSPPQNRQEGRLFRTLRKLAFDAPPFRWFFEREVFAVGTK